MRMVDSCQNIYFFLKPNSRQYLSNIKKMDLEDSTLIDLVRQFTHIYDKKEINFKNKSARRIVWIVISTVLNSTD